MASENAELLREVQELSANASLMLKTKASLVAALDEAKVIVSRSSGNIFPSNIKYVTHNGP